MGERHIQGLLLAGGQSTRMGTDKALLDIGGKPLVYRLVRQLVHLTDHVTVSVGRPEREAIYRANLGELADTVSYMSDIYPECGPLSGLHAGLSAIGSGYVFVMACDMPRVSEELLAALKAHMAQGADVIHVKGQPFHALYHAGTAPDIEASLKKGDLRLMGLLNGLRTIVVGPQQPNHMATFINLNTPAEYINYISDNS
ncbi:molybdopterin-guanine dinucleotide biosynthesis protein A [Paenibacillus endophyticus]|uniref:Probable molybdenum cofactor guanylyltransferase n=1 Tax=Paenibacillus endophyticus TaxID=1294268 RepID=A0A7W5GAC6_9BACL|nr:molybdenum cofactor guanylyltransferase [Paenibacillus endophyticus]MBB3152636.1 molybdopterin-guanine dinucleotide biosynthesis protein A [Paenibacillus endophyticus]